MANKFLTPTCSFVPTGSTSLQSLYELVAVQVAGMADFKYHKKLAAPGRLEVFLKGNAALHFFEDVFPFLRKEFYVLAAVELDVEQNRVLYSLQNFEYSKKLHELEPYSYPLRAIESMAIAQISPWFEAITLPETYLSNSYTFMKHRGMGSLFL